MILITTLGRLDKNGRPTSSTLKFNPLREEDPHGRADNMQEQNEEGWVNLLAEMEPPKMAGASDAKLDGGEWGKSEE